MCYTTNRHRRTNEIDLQPLEPRTLFSKAPLFAVNNLVSDNTTTIPAAHQDASVLDSWGLAAGPGTEWWVANNGAGNSTLYDGSGAADSLVVTIPQAQSLTGTSHPTGEVYNGGSGFQVRTNAPAQFIFDTEDGTISGWGPQADPTHAIIKIDNTASGAVYKGLANDSFNGADYILATNIHSGKVEVYDSNFAPAHLTGSFKDSKIPTGYAPFGIQNINGLIYVTYAAQDSTKSGDVAGKGHGFVDVYLPDGVLDRRLAKRGTLDSPWGIARIPGGFGKYKRDIAIGNFGNGIIQIFDPRTGELRGELRNKKNHVIAIDGLWSLQFGNDGLAGASNEMFFTAGPNAEADGLFGKLTLVPTTTPASTNPGGNNSGGYVYPQSAASSSQARLFSTSSVSDETCDHSADVPASSDL